MRDRELECCLIVATIDRQDGLERLFHSLSIQSYKHFHVILVDQNTDDRIVPIIQKYRLNFPLLHLRSLPGLSKARNTALTLARADIISFPDDDCWYGQETLQQITDLFLSHPEWDGVTGRASGVNGQESRWKWDKQSGPITRNNVWNRGLSISLFLRQQVTQAVGLFDQALGLGSGTIWGSGEETDYILRSLAKGFRLVYYPDLCIFHDDSIPGYSQQDAHIAYSYGAGMGRVLKKHRYPASYTLWMTLKPGINALRYFLMLQPHRAKYYYAVAVGRALGWLK